MSTELLPATGPAGSADVEAVIVSSVVPPLGAQYELLVERYIEGGRFFIVGPGLRTGMPIRIDNPHERHRSALRQPVTPEMKTDLVGAEADVRRQRLQLVENAQEARLRRPGQGDDDVIDGRGLAELEKIIRRTEHRVPFHVARNAITAVVEEPDDAKRRIARSG